MNRNWKMETRKRGAAMNWVSRLFGKRKREEELDEEVRSHLEMAARERVERGVDDEEAVRAARREFGNVELVREISGSVHAGLAIWCANDCQVAGIRGGGDSYAGVGHRREHRPVFGSERSVAESAAVSGARAARDTGREQTEF